MCVETPDVKEPQQWQAAKAPVYNEGTEEDEARRRGRRGTILTDAVSQSLTAPQPGSKQLLGQ